MPLALSFAHAIDCDNEIGRAFVWISVFDVKWGSPGSSNWGLLFGSLALCLEWGHLRVRCGFGKKSRACAVPQQRNEPLMKGGDAVSLTSSVSPAPNSSGIWGMGIYFLAGAQQAANKLCQLCLLSLSYECDVLKLFNERSKTYPWECLTLKRHLLWLRLDVGACDPGAFTIKHIFTKGAVSHPNSHAAVQKGQFSSPYPTTSQLIHAHTSREWSKRLAGFGHFYSFVTNASAPSLFLLASEVPTESVSWSVKIMLQKKSSFVVGYYIYLFCACGLSLLFLPKVQLQASKPDWRAR